MIASVISLAEHCSDNLRYVLRSEFCLVDDYVEVIGRHRYDSVVKTFGFAYTLKYEFFFNKLKQFNLLLLCACFDGFACAFGFDYCVKITKFLCSCSLSIAAVRVEECFDSIAVSAVVADVGRVVD